MYVSKLYCQDFRQFAQQTWDLTAGINLIVAPNGSGKTTVLEALSLLATGRSFRAGKTSEMIRFGQELARVYALTDDGVRLGMTLTGGMVGGRRTAVKHYLIDKTKKTQTSFVGNLLTVTFRPEDLRLIEGASSRRRDYLDGPLLLTSPVYRQADKNYQAALVRRNKTLKAIKLEGASPDLLTYWDRQLLEYGPVITQARREYIDYINTQVPFSRPYRVVYADSPITPERLAQTRELEQIKVATQVGPHRDNFWIEADLSGHQVDLAVYGSRGQQRLAVLWLKLAELAYLQAQTGRVPMLLLDDIFSELDDDARALVLAQIRRQTTVITSIDDNVVQLLDEQVKILRL